MTRVRARPPRVRLVCAVGALAVVVGCTGTGKPTKRSAGPKAPAPLTINLPAQPAPDAVTVATGAVPEVPIFDQAGATSSTRSITNPRPTGAPAVFLVLQRRDGWDEVLLPIRPSGSSGWVREADVTLSTHGWRIVVELALHRMTVFHGPVVVRIETVGVGTAATPTPGGRYYTTELLQPADPSGPYGSFAYGLNGFTGQADGAGTGTGDASAAGVFGQLGLHGTNDPSTLGRDVSLGCIRMSDDAMIALVGQLPLGVPVIVKA